MAILLFIPTSRCAFLFGLMPKKTKLVIFALENSERKGILYNVVIMEIMILFFIAQYVGKNKPPP